MIDKYELMQWINRAPDLWDRYAVYMLGLVGWLIIIYSYPIGWRLPVYADF